MKLWFISRCLFNHPAYYWYLSGNALCAWCTLRVCISRAYHARCSLRMTSAIYSRKWSFNVLYCCIRSYLPRALLWIVPITSNYCLTFRSSYSFTYDGNSFLRICTSMRTNEFLRSNCNYKLILCTSCCR